MKIEVFDDVVNLQSKLRRQGQERRLARGAGGCGCGRADIALVVVSSCSAIPVDWSCCGYVVFLVGFCWVVDAVVGCPLQWLGWSGDAVSCWRRCVLV